MRRDHENAWWDIMGKLQRIVRKAASTLLKGGVFTQEQFHHYSMSGKKNAQNRSPCVDFIPAIWVWLQQELLTQGGTSQQEYMFSFESTNSNSWLSLQQPKSYGW